MRDWVGFKTALLGLFIPTTLAGAMAADEGWNARWLAVVILYPPVYVVLAATVLSRRDKKRDKTVRGQ